MATDWAEVGAITTGAAAVATAVAAVFTALMATATRRDADASVKLVGEAQRDRELAHRPFLSLPGMGRSEGQVSGSFRVENIGMGPALGCVALIQDPSGKWCATTRGIDLASGEGSNMRLRLAKSNVKDYFGDGDGVIGALFCRDILDDRHRFLLRDTPTEQIVVFAWERFRTFDAEEKVAPAWAVESQLWETAEP
jgi:hypothetical protein